MKKQSRIVRLVSRIINVRRWFDWERMKAFTMYLGNGFKRLFVPQKKVEGESFNEAVQLFNLSDESLLIKQNLYFD